MAQVAFPDRLTLPPDSTGKGTGMFPVAVAGGTLYLPASVIVDANGNANDSSHPVHARLTDGTSNYDGAKTGQLPGTLVGGRLDVNVGAAAALTLGAGAATVGTVLNVGDVDHDAVNTGKVVQMGGHASPQATKPTAVATGDRVRQWLDPNGAMVISPRKLPTYRAVFRATARPNWLANAFGAAGRKQFATIHHAATATKTVRLRRVRVALMQNTVAALVLADLVRITSAPATGNPAITQGVIDPVDAVSAETVCLALPTTAGTEGTIVSTQGWDAGVIAGASTTAAGAVVDERDLLPPGNYDDESKSPTIRAGVLEGWAVTVDVNAATNPKMLVEIEWTEE